MSSEDRLVRLLQEARRALESERRRRTEPVAIVGIGCRFPGGASSPEAFWQLLRDGVDATRDVPEDRWDAGRLYDPDPDAPGKTYVRRGAFLDAIDAFDPGFFGISPREAAGLDPQQRLLLEVTWEALENAGVSPHALRGSATGVWVGLSLDDYAQRGRAAGDAGRAEAYTALGNARSLAAGRIAYFLDLRGPVLQLDTSCSSSLVALHLAAQSLRAGECDGAIVGGVSVMVAPDATIALSKLRALAADGRCKTFDASADGYARGEGCGVVVLKRLRDAVADGDRIWAMIRGSAVNHDGRSNGLTAPNGAAQEAVILAALANAGVDPAAVGYVEAHGTGTPLGDPIELSAIGRAYGTRTPPARPLVVGSVKTNIGHLEAAAGVASVIKVSLSLFHEHIPEHLHFHHPNPRVAWDKLSLRIAAGETWSRRSEPRLAGVSAFGISGTNAHVILEEPPPLAATAPPPARSAELVVLSAASEPALKESAARLRAHLVAHSEQSLLDVAHGLLRGRASLARRTALACGSREELCAALEDPGVASAGEFPLSGSPKVAFVFPGQGSQWGGMGRELLAEEPAFRQGLLECEEAIRRETGWSVVDELQASSEVSRLGEIDVAQPVLFAMEVALAALWRSWGVEPQAVVGHSMGEVAAACVAGALSMADAAAVICRRSALLRRIRGQGQMAVVELSRVEAQALVAGLDGKAGIAASNGPRSTVLWGDPRALQELRANLDRRGIFCGLVNVDVPSHSPRVEPLLGELMEGLAGVSARPARVPMLSTVAPRALSGPELDAAYWADNLRQPVSFASAIEKLLEDGVTAFVEVSPHPILVSDIEETIDQRGSAAIAVASLRRDQPQRKSLLAGLGRLHVHGQALDVRGLFPSGGRRIDLPTYPWQRERQWLDATSPAERRVSGEDHPLLGARLRAAGVGAAYESRWSRDFLRALRPPASNAAIAGVLLEATRVAAEVYAGGAPMTVASLLLEESLPPSDERPRNVQIEVDLEGRRITVHSQAEGGGDWIRHAVAEVSPDIAGQSPPRDLSAIRARCRAVLPARAGTATAAARAWVGEGEVLVDLVSPRAVETEAVGLPPAVLAEAIVAAGAALGAPCSEIRTLEGFSLRVAGGLPAAAHARRLEAPAGSSAFHLTLTDLGGRPIAEVAKVTFGARRSSLARQARAELARVLFRVDWLLQDHAVSAQVGRGLEGSWVVIDGATTANAPSAAGGLVRRGVEARVALLGERAGDADHWLCVWETSESVSRAGDLATALLEVARAATCLVSAPRLWWVTRRAIAVAPAEDVAPAASMVWGVGRTLAREHPELRLTLMDLEEQEDVAAVLSLEAALGDDEREIAWRSGRRHVPRLVPSETTSPNSDDRRALLGDGVVAVTGPFPAGVAIARELLRLGVARVFLAGGQREGFASGARLPEDLAGATSGRVTVAAVDLADAAALASAIAEAADGAPLRALIHSARPAAEGEGEGEQQEGRSDGARILEGLRAAWGVHTAATSLRPGRVIFFSSIAGTFGAPGAIAYAAESAFLEALAAHRRAQGLDATCVLWGPREGLGAPPTTQRHRAWLARQGIGTLRGRLDALFEAAIDGSAGSRVVASLDLRRLASSGADDVDPIWRRLVRPRVRAEGPDPSSVPAVASLSEAERAAGVRAAVEREASRVLGLSSPSTIGVDVRLRDLGLDSLMALELRNALTRRLGFTVPASVGLHQVTLRELSERLSTTSLELARRAGSRSRALAHGEVLAGVTHPSARLFCFHDAGGTATLFSGLATLGSAGIEVHAISHTRLGDASSAGARRYLAEAVAYVRGRGDEPYALFGHSLGGLFAWRVAQAVASDALPPPLFLGVSASYSPRAMRAALERPAEGTSLHQVFGPNGARTAALARDMKADLSLFAAMTVPERPLEVPILALRGAEDDVVSQRQMEGWAQETTRECEFVAVPGGHFYIAEDGPRAQLLLELSGRLGPALRGRAEEGAPAEPLRGTASC